jgi:hypothetical protein
MGSGYPDSGLHDCLASALTHWAVSVAREAVSPKRQKVSKSEEKAESGGAWIWYHELCLCFFHNCLWERSYSWSEVTVFSLPQRELTDLLGLHPRIETLCASCSALKSQPCVPGFVQQGFDDLRHHYQAVRKALEEYQQQLENGKYWLSSAVCVCLSVCLSVFLSLFLCLCSSGSPLSFP